MRHLWKKSDPDREHQLFLFPLFLFLYGWIAGSWEAHIRNYRHYVSQCPVSTLEWLLNFPHKAWVNRDESSFTCQVNRRASSSINIEYDFINQLKQRLDLWLIYLLWKILLFLTSVPYWWRQILVIFNFYHCLTVANCHLYILVLKL